MRKVVVIVAMSQRTWQSFKLGMVYSWESVKDGTLSPIISMNYMLPDSQGCSKQPPLKSQCPGQSCKNSETCKAMYLCFFWHWMCCHLLWQQWQTMTLTSIRSMVKCHRGPSANFPGVPLIYFVFKLLNLLLCIWVSTCPVFPGHVTCTVYGQCPWRPEEGPDTLELKLQKLGPLQE